MTTDEAVKHSSTRLIAHAKVALPSRIGFLPPKKKSTTKSSGSGLV